MHDTLSIIVLQTIVPITTTRNSEKIKRKKAECLPLRQNG